MTVRNGLGSETPCRTPSWHVSAAAGRHPLHRQALPRSGTCVLLLTYDALPIGVSSCEQDFCYRGNTNQACRVSFFSVDEEVSYRLAVAKDMWPLGMRLYGPNAPPITGYHVINHGRLWIRYCENYMT